MQRGPFIREYAIANGMAYAPEAMNGYILNSNEGFVLYQENAWHPAEVIPKLVYSAEEAEIITDIQVTLNDFVKEWTANFMAGNLDIDANWDAYLEELDNIGLQQAIEVVQGVYDRMYK